ncbi:MAG: phosphatase PAP2 family protein [Candidatus Micrarchaeaceae archaeon]
MLLFGIITQLNDAAFGLAKSVASSALDLVMKYWAESYFVVIPLLVIFLYLKKDSKVSTLVAAGITLFILGEVLKLIFAEPRPCDVAGLSWINQIGCESGYSFPSNHATVLTGLFMFFGKYKYIRTGYIIWMLVIMFGRIYLGQHYLTDVIVGGMISIAVCYAFNKYSGRIEGLSHKMINMIPVPIIRRSLNDHI